jgi:WD40 repeat protein
MKGLARWMLVFMLWTSSALAQTALPLEVRRNIVFFGHQEGMAQAYLEPGGRRVLSLGREGNLLEWDALSGQGLKVFDKSVQVANVLSFSPDGHFVLTTDLPRNSPQAGWDIPGVTLWNLESGKPEHSFEADRPNIYWSADGKTLGLLEEYLRSNGEPRRGITFWREGWMEPIAATWPQDHQDSNLHLVVFDRRAAFSADAQTLYVLREHDLAALETSSGKVLWTLEPKAVQGRDGKQLQNWTSTLALHPSGKSLLVGSSDGMVLLDLSSQKVIAHFDPRITDAFPSWNSDGTRLTLIERDGTWGPDKYVHVFEVSSGAEVGLVDGERVEGFGADSSELWTRWNSNWSSNWIRFDLKSGLEREVLTADTLARNAPMITLNTQGRPKRYIRGGYATEEHPEQIPFGVGTFDGKPPIDLVEHHSWLARYSPNRKYIASLGSGGRVWLLDTSSGKKIRDFLGDFDMAFSPNGKFIATGTYSDVLIYDLESGQLLKTLDANKAEAKQPQRQNWQQGRSDPGLRGMARAIAWSPDSKTIAVGYQTRAIGIWDVETATVKQRLFGHTNWVLSVAFSPDGKTLVSGAGDGTVRFWNLETSKSAVVQKIHTAFVRWVAFSADGNYLAAASGDGIVSLWDAKTARPLKRLQGHTDKVTSVVFSPDGKILFSSSSDGTVRLWSVPDGKALQTLPSVKTVLLSLALSPDRKALLSSARDNVLRFFGLPDDAPIFQQTESGGIK